MDQTLLTILAMSPSLVGLLGIVAMGAVGLRVSIEERKHEPALRQAYSTTAVLRAILVPGQAWRKSIDPAFHGTIERRRRAARVIAYICGAMLLVQSGLVVATRAISTLS